VRPETSCPRCTDDGCSAAQLCGRRRIPQLKKDEPQYRPELQHIAAQLRNTRAALTAELPLPGGGRCFVIGQWDLAYPRAFDIEDGRHYAYDRCHTQASIGRPMLNTLIALLVSGLGAATHQLPNAPCCGMRRC
jgi:hypothetical protein